jgi:hypothetical protein
MGQLDWIQVVHPPTEVAARHPRRLARPRRVSGTSCIRKQTFKPGNNFIGSRVETRRLSSYGSAFESKL